MEQKQKHKCNKLAMLNAWNPYLCKECFIERHYGYLPISDEQKENMFNRAVAEHRLPRWECTQEGTAPYCGCCFKAGVVYG